MIKRDFLPGNEWLYFKIYTGLKSADKILVELINPFIVKMKNERLVQDFFFIRYNDPKFHLRLRFKVINKDCFNGIMKEFIFHFENAFQDGLISRVNIDVYNREIERYGEDSIEIIEKLFCIDSAMQISLIQAIRDNGDNDLERWLSSLVIIDDFLTLIGYDLVSKQTRIEYISNAFKREFGITSSKLEKPLNDKFRTHRRQIESILAHEALFSKYESIFTKRNELIQPVIKQLNDVTKNHHPNLDELVSSIIHMMMNRLFRSNNRTCELVVYHLINKYYISQIAQMKNRQNE